LDAMKEQLMNQRIMIGTQVVMILVICALCVTVVLALRQNQHMQEALIARLEAVSAKGSGGVNPATAASYDWPRFHFQVVGADGKGIPELRASLAGEPYNAGERLSLSATTDATGRASVGPMRAGGYILRIRRGAN